MNNWEDISALADDQLEASKAAEMRRAMEADPNLRSQYEDLLSLKRALRNDLPTHDSPETLSLCLDRVREVDRVGRTENVVHKFRYAIATGLAALLVGAAVYNNSGSANIMDRSAIARSLSAGAAGGREPIRVEGPASQWVREQLDAAPISAELVVKTAERLVIDGRAVGRYFLTDGEADYVYLITPGIVDCEGTPIQGYDGIKKSRISGLNALSWSENNMSFVFVSDQPVSRMLEFITRR
jgi:anti-sigma factor RsiW